MEKLADLPLKENEMTTQEQNVLQKYFGDEPKKSKLGMKCLLFALVTFLLVANPFVAPIFSKLPYMKNPLAVFALQFVIFLIAFVALNRYL